MKTVQETKTVAETIYRGCGFPVKITNAPMRKFRGEWMLDIDPISIDEKVALFLASQPSRLTGRQVEFVRKWSVMSVREFAKVLSVTHPAVLKWERAGNKATSMDMNTEKVLRIHTFMRLGFSPVKILEIVTSLNAKRKPQTLEIKGNELAAA